MFQLTHLLGIRHLRNQWLRNALSTMGIVIGVTSFIFGPAIGATLSASLDMSAEDIAGNTTLEITARTGISSDQLAQLNNTEGISLAVPSVHGGGLALGDNHLLAFWGIDPAIDREVRTYAMASGNFLSTQGEALITQRYADDKGLSIGDTLSLISTGGMNTLQVVGILSDSGVARLNSGDIIIMTLEDTMRLNNTTHIDTVHILPAHGVSDESLTQTIQAILGDTATISPPASHLNGAKVTASVISIIMFLTILMMLSIGALLIYNSITVSVAQRRAEIGILRALGLEKRQIRNMFLLEATVIGFIGSIIGVIGGHLMLNLVGVIDILPRDFISTSPLQSKATFSAPLWLPIVSVIFGTLFSTSASYFASKQALIIAPTEAMIQIRSQTGQLKLNYWGIFIALTLTIVAILFGQYYQGDIQVGIIWSNFITYSLVVSYAWLLSPLLLLGDIFIKRTQARGWGLNSWMAMINLTRRPKRILSTGILLLIGGMMFIYISQSNYGFTSFVDEWDANENVGDLVLVGAGINPTLPVVNLPQTVIDDVLARPDVVNGLAELTIVINSENVPYKIRALAISDFTDMGGRFIWKSGDSATALAQLVDHHTPAIVLHLGNWTLSQSIHIGDLFPLQTPQGKIDFRVAGTIFGGIGFGDTTIVMDKGLYANIWGDTNTNRLAIKLADGADIQAVRRELLRQYTAQGVIVYDVNDILNAFAERFSNIGNTSIVFSSLFTLIIIVGIGSTFYILVLDRRREIAMLRALGMTQNQIRRSILLEGVLLFLMTCVISIPGAYVATHLQALGMQNITGFKFGLESGQVISHVAILLSLVIIAMSVPSVIGGKTDILEAMRYE